MLDLRKLRMLAELDRLGSVAGVARSLHVTAPGISMQLAALEREVGLRLTEKRGRGIVLTPAGKLVAQHGHDLLGRVALAETEVAALRAGQAGTYRIAAFPSIARSVVADTWRRVRDQTDLDLRIELIELEPQASLPALAAGEVDIAVTHSYSNMPDNPTAGLTTVPIATEPVWLALRADHPLAGDDPLDLRQLATADWVVPHREWTCYDMVQRACGVAGFVPTVVAEATDFSVLLALVSAGAGVAMIPELTIAELPGDVVLRELRAPVFRHDFVVTRASSGADAGIHRLRDLLVESAVARLGATRVLERA